MYKDRYLEAQTIEVFINRVRVSLALFLTRVRSYNHTIITSAKRWQKGLPPF